MLEAIMLGVALAMDSLTMSIVNGMKYKDYDTSKALISSLSFGFFQGFMPLLGYLILLPFISYIEDIDHWLVLAILSYLGIKMIVESFNSETVEKSEDTFTFKTMIIESIATSIDALSSCVLLPTIKVNPYLTCFIIFVVTTLICIVGHGLGKKTGTLLKERAPIVGGIILILLGVKCVLEHLQII